MGCDLSKNKLLDLYYEEGSKRHLLKIKKHSDECAECQDYLNLLQKTQNLSSQIPEVEPPLDAFDKIMGNLPIQKRKEKRQPSIYKNPVFGILGGMLAIFIFVGLVSHLLVLWGGWEYLKRFDILQVMGPLLTTLCGVVLFGFFATLSLAPVLVLSNQNGRSTIIKKSFQGVMT